MGELTPTCLSGVWGDMSHSTDTPRRDFQASENHVLHILQLAHLQQFPPGARKLPSLQGANQRLCRRAQAKSNRATWECSDDPL